MKKRYLLLVPLFFFLLSVPAFAEKEPTFAFELSVNGKKDIQASAGDILTVTLTLKRTDGRDPFTMYAMQSELIYDSTFFRLVENSDQPEAEIRTGDLALRDHRRAHYLNYVSLSGGRSWPAKQTLGTFQLEVIGDTGRSVLENRNFRVSLPDGSDSYPVAANDLTVTVSQRSSVVFESQEGNEVSTQTVETGGLLAKPDTPVRTGYRFAGWFLDIDRTRAWDFSVDRVEHNIHLYAKWDKVDPNLRYTDMPPDHWAYADVEYVSRLGLMSGVGESCFAPESSTDRAMIVTILWRLEGKPLVNDRHAFRDVPEGQWYSAAVRWAAAEGITDGYSTTAFGPNDKVTREQMAVILYRYALFKGYDTSRKNELSEFSDVEKVSSWAQEGLSWANAAGLVNGMPGELLAPQAHATRCQTAAILHRFCENIQ